jgi:hypothetical protein
MSDVVYDSVDSTIKIGGVSEYGLIKAELNNNTVKEAAKANVTIYKPENVKVPEYNDNIEVYINDEIIYRGKVKETKYVEGETPRKIRLVCYDLIRELKNETYTSSYARNKENLEEVGVLDGDDKKTDYPYEKTLAQLVEDVVATMMSNIEGYNIKDDLILNFDTSTAKISGTQNLESGDDFYPNNTAMETTIGIGKDVENFGIVIDVEEKTCKKVLDKLATISGGTWYVNRENKIVFGKPLIPKENKDGSAYTLNYIRKREDGENKTAHRGVKVIGADITRTEVSYAENKVGITTKQTRRYKPTTVEKGKKPYYKYSDADITSKEQAEKVANNLYSKIKSNENSGTVEAVVDTQKIKPYTIIQYPDNLGGYRFFVKSVKHTINNDDGFFSTVNLGSLVNEEQIESE